MEGPVRKSKIWFFSFEALNAEKRGVRGVCAGINYDYWSGKIRKKWRKKCALVPSDEGRVRKSSSVYTMFAIRDASGVGIHILLAPENGRRVLRLDLHISKIVASLLYNSLLNPACELKCQNIGNSQDDLERPLEGWEKCRKINFLNFVRRFFFLLFQKSMQNPLW